MQLEKILENFPEYSMKFLKKSFFKVFEMVFLFMGFSLGNGG